MRGNQHISVCDYLGFYVTEDAYNYSLRKDYMTTDKDGNPEEQTEIFCYYPNDDGGLKDSLKAIFDIILVYNMCKLKDIGAALMRSESEFASGKLSGNQLDIKNMVFGPILFNGGYAFSVLDRDNFSVYSISEGRTTKKDQCFFPTDTNGLFLALGYMKSKIKTKKGEKSLTYLMDRVKKTESSVYRLAEDIVNKKVKK